MSDQLSSKERVSYALAKQVPDIARRAVFETNYGQLALDGEDARQVAELVQRLLMRQVDARMARKPLKTDP